jgi:hypothetical protein
MAMMEPRVYIAQILCPSRHCVVGAANVCETDEQIDTLREMLQAKFDSMCAPGGGFNRKCELCGSTVLHIEVGRTQFKNVDEAMPHLRESEKTQRLVAAFLKATRN